MRLNEFSHDRTKPLERASGDLYKFLEEFSDQPSLNNWYVWFQRYYGIPAKVVKHYFKRTLAEQFDYVDAKRVPRKLLVARSWLGALIYIGLIFRIFISRLSQRRATKTTDLLLIHTEDTNSLKRFERLFELFGPNKVLVVVPNPQSIMFPGITVLHRPRFVNYRADIKELFVVLISTGFHLFYSIRTGANLIYMAGKILDSVFYYRTLFEEISAKHVLGFQHYHTNAIANYLFKQSGGLNVAYIQKNISTIGRNGFYFDMDCFFTLGKVSAVRAIQLGARIEEMVPIGSFFMESELSKGSIADEPLMWDIVCLGGNSLHPGTFNDTYDAHNNDYLEHLNWLRKSSIDFPNLRIGFKPHQGDRTRFPRYEEEFLAGSNVQLIDNNLSSYKVCFQSRLIVSWCSTMVVELYAYGKPAFFLDPGGRNQQFISQEIANVGIRLKTYEEFLATISNSNDRTNHQSKRLESELLCLRSENVSRKIYDHLMLTSDRFERLARSTDLSSEET